MYTAKNYTHLLGMPGFSDALLLDHFTLYEGYVSNTNTTLKQIAAHVDDDVPTLQAELRRRLGWEWNGMRLHEYYFDTISKEKKTSTSAPFFTQEMIKHFGSVDHWQKDFVKAGSMRGIGWVILMYDAAEQCFLNTWITEHDAGHLSGAQPIVVMDVFEHAYLRDYGIKRPDYIEVFMKAMNWEKVESRVRSVGGA